MSMSVEEKRAYYVFLAALTICAATMAVKFGLWLPLALWARISLGVLFNVVVSAIVLSQSSTRCPVGLLAFVYNELPGLACREGDQNVSIFFSGAAVVVLILVFYSSTTSAFWVLSAIIGLCILPIARLVSVPFE